MSMSWLLGASARARRDAENGERFALVPAVQDALRRAREATEKTIEAFATGHGLEIAAMELRIARQRSGDFD